jgi:hypothetical protein
MSKPNRPNLAELLAESARKAEQELADKQRVERITAAVKAQLAHKHKAEADDDDLVCPSCGYKAPEAEFEPDTDEESDSYRTDDVTSESGQNDEDNQGDRPDLPEEFDNRKAHRPLNGMTRDQVIASLGKIRC